MSPSVSVLNLSHASEYLSSASEHSAGNAHASSLSDPSLTDLCRSYRRDSVPAHQTSIPSLSPRGLPPLASVSTASFMRPPNRPSVRIYIPVVACGRPAGAKGRSNPLSTETSDSGGMTTPKHGSTEEICDVAGCGRPAERSINIKQASRSKLTLKSSDLRSVHLCKEHYKEYKKETKTDRELDSYY